MVIFTFVFIGFFAVVMGTIPSQFFYSTWNPEYQTDKVAVAMFEAANITAYRQLNSTDITFPGTEQLDVGLADGHFMEVWWGTEYGRNYFEIRHIWPSPLGSWWMMYERLIVTPVYRQQAGISASSPIGLEKEHVENLWENELENASYCEWAVNGYYAQTFIYPYDNSWTIGDAWENHHLNVTIGYEYDWNATSVNAFNILARLLTFQSPDLGLGTGVHATIFNAAIAIPLWVMIAIAILKLIQSVIPFIKGTDD